MSATDKAVAHIHGYLSRVWVGRGSDEIDQQSSWAGAVMQKSPVNAEKSEVLWTDGPTRRTSGPMDRPTDQLKGRAG